MSWFQDAPAGGLGGPARDAILAELCEAKRTGLVATPYLSFDTRFLAREGEELSLWATLTRSTAENTLVNRPLRLRFPWALSMWAGETRLLGYEQQEKRRWLRLAVPEALRPDEQRAAPRIDRCGRSTGTLGNDDLTVVRVALENLSLGGAGIFIQEAFGPEAFPAGRVASLSLHLEGGLDLVAPVRLVHGEGMRQGVAFQPPLEGMDLARLQAWIAPRWAEARRAWDNRAALGAEVLAAAAPVMPEGILLLTAEADLVTQVGMVLQDLPALRTAPPQMALLKKALMPPPLLVLMHLPKGGLEERRKARAFLEALPEAPVVLLAEPTAVALAQELGTEFKALSLAWNPSLGAFLRRMVTGLLKRTGRV